MDASWKKNRSLKNWCIALSVDGLNFIYVIHYGIGEE
jgi:hypothetical protein